jgi:hypothetical protein
VINITMTPPTVYTSLDKSFAKLGTRLFTVTCHDEAAGLHHRVYSSNSDAYPAGGTKPLTHDGWYALCVTAQKIFVANTPAEFAKYFFDHALITSLNLGSCINIPVVHQSQVLGTLNLLASAHHFTAEKLARYAQIVTQNHQGLIAQMLNE